MKRPTRRKLTQEMIAAAAYERFLRRGGEHGHDFDDWLAAENELLALVPDGLPRSMRASRTPAPGGHDSSQ